MISPEPFVAGHLLVHLLLQVLLLLALHDGGGADRGKVLRVDRALVVAPRGRLQLTGVHLPQIHRHMIYLLQKSYFSPSQGLEKKRKIYV